MVRRRYSSIILFLLYQPYVLSSLILDTQLPPFNTSAQTFDLSSSARGYVISGDPCTPTGIYLKYLPCLWLANGQGGTIVYLESTVNNKSKSLKNQWKIKYWQVQSRVHPSLCCIPGRRVHPFKKRFFPGVRKSDLVVHTRTCPHGYTRRSCFPLFTFSRTMFHTPEYTTLEVQTKKGGGSINVPFSTYFYFRIYR